MSRRSFIDSAILQQICLRFSGRLHGFFRAKRIPADDVDDLTQETFLRLWKRRARVRPEKVERFLFAVARRVALEYGRQRSRDARDLAALQSVDPQGRGKPNPRDIVAEREESSLVLEAISRLPQRLREVVTLIYLGDMSRDEVSRSLGIRRKSVYDYDWEARRRLLADLDGKL